MSHFLKCFLNSSWNDVLFWETLHFGKHAINKYFTFDTRIPLLVFSSFVLCNNSVPVFHRFLKSVMLQFADSESVFSNCRLEISNVWKLSRKKGSCLSGSSRNHLENSKFNQRSVKFRFLGLCKERREAWDDQAAWDLRQGNSFSHCEAERRARKRFHGFHGEATKAHSKLCDNVNI